MAKKPNQLLYVDVGLKLSGGHHLVHASAVESMMKEIGWEVRFLGAKGNRADVPLENFEAVFELPMWSEYGDLGTAHIARRFEDHVQSLAKAFEVLLSWPNYTKILIASSVFPVVRGLEIFFQRNTGYSKGKTFYFELNHSPELGKPRGFYGHASTWYGHCFYSMQRQGVDARLLATDPWLKKDYGSIVSSPVREVALIRKLPPLNLDGRKKVVGFLGFQAPHKGYHLLPDLLERFLSQYSDWSAFIHQSSENDHHYYRQIDQKLIGLRGSGRKIQFVKGPLSETQYQEVLNQVGMLCLPYDPVFYSRAPSGVAQESIINAIPAVVPSNTTISEMGADYGYPFVEFSSWDSLEVSRAMSRCIDLASQAEPQRTKAALKMRKVIAESSLAFNLALDGNCIY